MRQDNLHLHLTVVMTNFAVNWWYISAFQKNQFAALDRRQTTFRYRRTIVVSNQCEIYIVFYILIKIRILQSPHQTAVNKKSLTKTNNRKIICIRPVSMCIFKRNSTAIKGCNPHLLYNNIIAEMLFIFSILKDKSPKQ